MKEDYGDADPSDWADTAALEDAANNNNDDDDGDTVVPAPKRKKVTLTMKHALSSTYCYTWEDKRIETKRREWNKVSGEYQLLTGKFIFYTSKLPKDMK